MKTYKTLKEYPLDWFSKSCYFSLYDKTPLEMTALEFRHFFDYRSINCEKMKVANLISQYGDYIVIGYNKKDGLRNVQLLSKEEI